MNNMGKRKHFVAAAVLLLIAAGALTFGKNFIKGRYVSRDVDGEVLGWDPAKAELKVKLSKGSAVFTTVVPIDPPETTVYTKAMGRDEDGAEAPAPKELSGRDDDAWENAFCVGDVVRLTSEEFDVTRAEVGETLRVDFVQKISGGVCEK